MSFCIMRMAKLKGWMNVRMSLQHNTRERMPPNADPKWSGENYNYGGDTEDTMCRMDRVMPEKIRDNAVYAVEVVMTASPDFSGNWKEYLQACDKWAQGIFGKENLMHINHHFDESTPHTHILFTPIKDGKLNAKHFIGGHRDRMAELQNDFYEKVGKQFELERGQSREETKARHAHHTLAGKAAELDEKAAELDEREIKFSEKEKRLQETLKAFGDKGIDIKKILAEHREFMNMTSQDCLNMSKAIDRITPQGYQPVPKKIKDVIALREQNQSIQKQQNQGLKL